jgi:hypothetical protein
MLPDDRNKKLSELRWFARRKRGRPTTQFVPWRDIFQGHQINEPVWRALDAIQPSQREKSEQMHRERRAAYSRRFPTFSSNLETITDVARVPQKRRAHFQEDVISSMTSVWNSYNVLPKLHKGSSLPRAVEAAVRLNEALAELTVAESDLVEGFFQCDSFHWSAEFREIAFRFADRLTSACGSNISVRRIEEGPRPNSRGRRPGTVKNPQFSVFVFNLVCDAFYYGGRLTLEKNTPSGSLVNVIDILTPYVPSGFVPDPLPGSSMRTWWQQGRAKGLQPFPPQNEGKK